MKQILEKYNLERIDYLRNNKDQITEDVLTELRSYGVSGKQIALDILEKRDDENLSEIHMQEIVKCINDVIYFKDNYLLVLNKDELQDKFLKAIKVNQKTQITSARCTKKSYAAAIYALWQFNFFTGKTIGIVASNQSTAKNTISNISNLYTRIPSWMQMPAKHLKTSITSKEGNNRIIIDSINENAFRGLSLDVLVIDNLSMVKSSKFYEFFAAVFPSIVQKIDYKIIAIEENPDINLNFFEVNEDTVLPVIEEPVITEKPILRRSFTTMLKDFFKKIFRF